MGHRHQTVGQRQADCGYSTPHRRPWIKARFGDHTSTSGWAIRIDCSRKTLRLSPHLDRGNAFGGDRFQVEYSGQSVANNKIKE